MCVGEGGGGRGGYLPRKNYVYTVTFSLLSHNLNSVYFYFESWYLYDGEIKIHYYRRPLLFPESRKIGRKKKTNKIITFFFFLFLNLTLVFISHLGEPHSNLVLGTLATVLREGKKDRRTTAR